MRAYHDSAYPVSLGGIRDLGHRHPRHRSVRGAIRRLGPLFGRYGVAIGTGVAAGVGSPCLVGSSPYLFVHPAQNSARENGIEGIIFMALEAVTVNNRDRLCKFETINRNPRRPGLQ